MTDSKNLKHLKRIELLEILVSLSDENESLKAEIASLNARLDSKETLLDKTDSMVEAAISVSGLFSAVQAAAEQYLENIKNLSANAQVTADRVLSDTRQQCESMKQQTQAEIDIMWSELTVRMEQYRSFCNELQAILPYLHRYTDELRNAET